VRMWSASGGAIALVHLVELVQSFGQKAHDSVNSEPGFLWLKNNRF
jgi:hypothetical protein